MLRWLLVALFSIAAASRTATAKPFAPTAFGVDVRGAGRPVILIPGLGCPASVWDEVATHLVATGHEVHVLAIAGFAGRAAIEGDVGAAVRADLVAYIRDRGLDHPVVVGHSLGGFLAFWLAASEPALVGPTVIVDAAPYMFSEADPKDVAANAARWRGFTDAQFATAIAEYFGAMANDRKRMDPIIAAVAHSDRRAFIDAFVEMSRVDVRAKLAATTVPVLAILAEGQAFAAKVAGQMAPIKDRTIVALPNTRHFVFFDDPIGFDRELDKFLVAHPAAARRGMLAAP